MATSDNVANLGRDLLLILIWIGAWGTLELFIQYLSSNHKIQLVLYLCLFVAGFVSLMFVEAPTVDGKSGTMYPQVSPDSLPRLQFLS